MLIRIALLFFSFATFSFASSIVPIDGQKIYKSPASSEDVIVVNPSNEAGISINYFSEFVVNDKPLKIVNTPVNHGPDEYQDAAMLVVVIADDISISNQVELLGPASDILFLSKDSDGRISCSNCSFENFYRITLAVAETEPTFPVSGGLIGKLSTTPSGEVAINNLTARGALAVETLADVVSLDGVISTHDRADAEGLANINGYSQNQNGNFTIGTGSVNLMMGQMEWSYDSQAITKVTPLGREKTLNGSIKSVEVKVTSSDSIRLNTHIDTRVDLLSTTQYKGFTYLPSESIYVQDFGEKITFLGGALYSNSKAEFKTNAVVNVVSSFVDFKVDSLSFIAIQGFYNDQVIQANNIYIAADNVINRGVIRSNGKLEIWSDYHILNEYGGELHADNIVIESERGNLINGEKSPYIQEKYAAYSQSILNPDVTVGTVCCSGMYRYGDTVFKTPYLSSYLYGAVYDRDFMRSGTYYSLNIEEASGKGVKPDSLRGIISGVNVSIKVKDLFNVNPYWEVVSEDLVKLDNAMIRQVGILAEELLRVRANFLVNSSAFIELKSTKGQIEIDAKLIVNERYRTLNLLEKERFNGVEAYVTKSYTYSPPGYITSLGNLLVKARSAFVNDTGYVEVFGDASFDGYIRDIGVVHDDIYINNELSCVQGALSFSCVNKPGFSYVDPKQVDSLFYVHGDTIGKEGRLIVQNIELTDFFIGEIAEDKKSQIDTQGYKSNPYNGASISKHVSVSGNTIKTSWTYKCGLGPCGNQVSLFPNLPNYSFGGEIKGPTKTYSLKSELSKLYQAMLKIIEDLMNEIKWWDEE